jgi:hypothetical protein
MNSFHEFTHLNSLTKLLELVIDSTWTQLLKWSNKGPPIAACGAELNLACELIIVQGRA